MGTWYVFSELEEGDKMRIQILTNTEISSAVLENRYNCSGPTRDPEVGGCVHVNIKIFSQVMCIFSQK